MLGFAPLGQPPLGGTAGTVSPAPAASSLFDYMQTVISQFANSPILLQLIANLTDYFDPTTKFDAFFRQVWNLPTAEGWGLDVLGRIVGVNRVLRVPTGGFLGFVSDTSALPFGEGIFYSGGAVTANYTLTDSAYRILIMAKALLNITNGSIPAINQILINLFPNYGNAHVTDGLDMTMTYTFYGAITPVDLAIIGSSGVLPKPAGVSVTVVQLENPITTESGLFIITEDGQQIVTEG